MNQFPNKYLFETGNSYTALARECLIYIFQGKIHFKEIHSDIVFCVEGLGIKPKYILNSGKNKFTTEIRKKLVRDMSKIKSVIMQNNVLETVNYLFFQYSFNYKAHFLIYNKKTLEQHEANGLKGFINDLDGGPNIHLKTTKDDNTVISWINAIELKNHVASNAFKNSTPKYPERKKELEKLANSLDENDNPVLMLLKLKD